MEGGAGVGAGGGRTRGVLGAEGVFDDAAAHRINGRYATFGIDEEILPTDGAADLRGELRFLAYVHRTCFLVFTLQIQETAANSDSALGLLFRMSGYHDNFGDVTGRPGRACEKSFPGELRRTCPAWQSEEIHRMRGGGLVAALFPRMVISEFAQNDGSHGSAFGGRVLLPIETEALTTDATANVLPELRPSK